MGVKDSLGPMSSLDRLKIHNLKIQIQSRPMSAPTVSDISNIRIRYKSIVKTSILIDEIHGESNFR